MTDPGKTALITGITGQDGSYLAELLLAKGYEVHGLIRRSSSFSTGRIDHLYRDPHEPGARLFLHYGDLTDSSSLIDNLNRIQPDEVYNLGAQSHVKVSFEMPEFTADTAGMGTLRLLEAIRHADWPIRFYQAGSSEMFGLVRETPQTETTPFYPRSPYAVAKVFAHWMTVQYREAYGLFAGNGILFNHESPRRGGTFVTRKVTRGIAAILAGGRTALPGQPRRPARLGLRPGVRRGDVADAPAAGAGRLRDRHRRDALGPRVRERGLRARRARLGGPRRDRPALLPADRGRRAVRRCLEGGARARLAPAGDVPGARPDHARGRPARGRAWTRRR